MKLVDLHQLSPEDLRHLAFLRESAGERDRSERSRRLERHLVRLAWLLPEPRCSEVEAALRTDEPSAVLAHYFDDFLGALAIRAELPPDERGEPYRITDIADCDD